jgi:Pol polyprotein
MQKLLSYQPAYGAYALSAFGLRSSTVPTSGHIDMKKEWLFDTCASYHMTANRDRFVSYRPADKDQGICDAQGGRGRPLGKGTVIIKTGDGGILKLDDVLHIPTLHANLISGALLEEQGFQVEKSTFYVKLHDLHS